MDGFGSFWNTMAKVVPAWVPGIGPSAEVLRQMGFGAEAGLGCGSNSQHTVTAGETLYGIATQHGTTVNAILAANPDIEDPDMIHEGATLKLPAGCKAGLGADGLGAAQLPAPVKEFIEGHGGPEVVAAWLKQNLTTYTAKEGDTISSIATSHGINSTLLLALNPSVNRKTLSEGTTLTVPVVEDDGMGGCEYCLPEWEEEEDFAGGMGGCPEEVDDADADGPEDDGMGGYGGEAADEEGLGCGGGGGRGAGGQQQGDWRQDQLAIVNQQRAKHGAGGLALDEALCRAAQGHANDMAARNFMSHNGSNGSHFSARINAAGFRGGGARAENVAAGQRSNADVMNSWMNSQGHRTNILNGQYALLGVGYNNGKWCQVFASR